MTDTQQQTALVLLRMGRSYAEAAESSGLTVEQVMKLWQDHLQAQTPPPKQ